MDASLLVFKIQNYVDSKNIESTYKYNIHQPFLGHLGVEKSKISNRAQSQEITVDLK